MRKERTGIDKLFTTQELDICDAAMDWEIMATSPVWKTQPGPNARDEFNVNKWHPLSRSHSTMSW